MKAFNLIKLNERYPLFLDQKTILLECPCCFTDSMQSLSKIQITCFTEIEKN